MGLLTDISLRGDGRVVVLRPETVRQTMYQVIFHNTLGSQSLHPFEGVQLRTAGTSVGLLDWVLRRNGAAAAKQLLSESETKLVERLLNRLLLDRQLSLSWGEKRLYTARHNRTRIEHTVKFGVVFELELIPRSRLLWQEDCDFCLEWPDRSLQIVRYLGAHATREQWHLVFAQRFDLARQVRLTLNDLRVRHVFRIKRMTALPRYRLTNCQAMRQAILPVEKLTAASAFWWPQPDRAETQRRYRIPMPPPAPPLSKKPQQHCRCLPCRLLAASQGGKNTPYGL